MYPGPTIYAREEDRVVVNFTNLTPCNISIHRQASFKYRFTLLNQRGTLFRHAHVSWLRATIHGTPIIYPKQGVSYPFEPSLEEHVIVLGI
ncbi:hypothetical protein CRYUN_Cryun22dG0109300 [Craigia yunnanensis]